MANRNRIRVEGVRVHEFRHSAVITNVDLEAGTPDVVMKLEMFNDLVGSEDEVQPGDVKYFDLVPVR